MDEILAGIYGTGGAEKIASLDDPNQPATLEDLALVLTTELVGEDADMAKVASVHEQLYNQVVEFDRAGRGVAHSHVSELEKQAAEGDPSGLLEFYYGDQEPDEGEEQYTDVRQAILLEIQRRGAQE